MEFKIIYFDDIINKILNTVDKNIIYVEILIFIIFKTAFYLAVEKEKTEIIKLLLTNEKLNINIPCVLICLFIKFEIFFNEIKTYFNGIQNLLI